MRAPRRRATDHRAIVLEVVATTPAVATRAAVQAEVAAQGVGDGFGANQISAMVSTLLREGLLGRKEDGTLFVTAVGLEWLQFAAFDRALPAPHTKPGRKRK